MKDQVKNEELVLRLRNALDLGEADEYYSDAEILRISEGKAYRAFIEFNIACGNLSRNVMELIRSDYENMRKLRTPKH